LFNGEGHDLKEFMRKDASGEDIEKRIIDIWSERKDHYSNGRTAETRANRKKIEMS
jgi:GTP 3',8-cyclase